MEDVGLRLATARPENKTNFQHVEIIFLIKCGGPTFYYSANGSLEAEQQIV